MRAAPGAVLTQSSAATHDVSDMLRHYPVGDALDAARRAGRRRSATGTAPARACRSAAPGGSGGESVAVSGGAFTDLVTHRDLGIGFILVAIGIAMFWGAVHALSPGPREVDRRGVSRGLARHRPARGVPRPHRDDHPHGIDLRPGDRDALPLALHPARDALSVALGDLRPRGRGHGRLDPRAPGAQAAGAVAHHAS